MNNLLLKESSVTLQLQHERLVLETALSQLVGEREQSVLDRKRSVNEIDYLIKDTFSELKNVCDALEVEPPKIIFNVKITESINTLKLTASRLYGVSIDEMMTKTRKREVVEARQLVMTMAKKFHPKKTLEQIGGIFGKDHATALHAFKEIGNRIETGQLLVTLPESWI